MHIQESHPSVRLFKLNLWPEKRQLRKHVFQLPCNSHVLVRSASKAVLCVTLRRNVLHRLVPSSLPETAMAAGESQPARVRR